MILLGFVLGTAASILFSLVSVSFIFLVLGDEYPRLQAEFASLRISLALFALLTVFAALSFYGELKSRSWRFLAFVPLAITLATITGYYWPE